MPARYRIPLIRDTVSVNGTTYRAAGDGLFTPATDVDAAEMAKMGGIADGGSGGTVEWALSAGAATGLVAPDGTTASADTALATAVTRSGLVPGVTTVSVTVTAAVGATVTAANLIPDGVFVLGVTTEILVALGATTGTSGYTVGDGSDADVWGVAGAITAGTATGAANYTNVLAAGLRLAATSVVLTAAGGNFDGTGSIKITLRYLTVAA
jgi:hypothetical protein